MCSRRGPLSIRTNSHGFACVRTHSQGFANVNARKGGTLDSRDDGAAVVFRAAAPCDGDEAVSCGRPLVLFTGERGFSFTTHPSKFDRFGTRTTGRAGRTHQGDHAKQGAHAEAADRAGRAVPR